MSVWADVPHFRVLECWWSVMCTLEEKIYSKHVVCFSVMSCMSASWQPGKGSTLLPQHMLLWSSVTGKVASGVAGLLASSQDPTQTVTSNSTPTHLKIYTKANSLKDTNDWNSKSLIATTEIEFWGGGLGKNSNKEYFKSKSKYFPLSIRSNLVGFYFYFFVTVMLIIKEEKIILKSFQRSVFSIHFMGLPLFGYPN